jgi:hypothetical protein
MIIIKVKVFWCWALLTADSWLLCNIVGANEFCENPECNMRTEKRRCFKGFEPGY